MSNDTIWVTWEEQRRNASAAKEFGADLHVFNYHHLSRVKRYATCVVKTLKLFFKEKPKVVVAQNPSVVLAMLTVLCSYVFRFKSIIDSHNFAFALDTKSKILTWTSRFIQRHATAIIAHNDQLKEKMESRGGNIFALPDRVPEISGRQIGELGKHSVLYICSWSDDEPYNEVIEAANLVPDVNIYISGNYNKRLYEIGPIPDNVILIGRVPFDVFDNYLTSVDVVMDLTTREDCLLCGNYEAVAVEKPLITSNTKALRSYFTRGTITTKNTVEGISKAVQYMFGLNEHFPTLGLLQTQMKQLRETLEVDWFNRLAKIQRFINDD